MARLSAFQLAQTVIRNLLRSAMSGAECGSLALTWRSASEAARRLTQVNLPKPPKTPKIFRFLKSNDRGSDLARPSHLDPELMCCRYGRSRDSQASMSSRGQGRQVVPYWLRWMRVVCLTHECSWSRWTSRPRRGRCRSNTRRWQRASLRRLARLARRSSARAGQAGSRPLRPIIVGVKLSKKRPISLQLRRERNCHSHRPPSTSTGECFG